MVRSSPWMKLIKLEIFRQWRFCVSEPHVSLDMICLRLQKWTSEFAFLQGLQEQNQTRFPLGTGVGIFCFNYYPCFFGDPRGDWDTSGKCAWTGAAIPQIYYVEA